MEGRIMTFKSNYDMYDANNANIKDLNNKLFCTFTSGEELDELVSELSTVYTIMYNKMFVLFVKSTNEYVFNFRTLHLLSFCSFKLFLLFISLPIY